MKSLFYYHFLFLFLSLLFYFFFRNWLNCILSEDYQHFDENYNTIQFQLVNIVLFTNLFWMANTQTQVQRKRTKLCDPNNCLLLFSMWLYHLIAMADKTNFNCCSYNWQKKNGTSNKNCNKICYRHSVYILFVFFFCYY